MAPREPRANEDGSPGNSAPAMRKSWRGTTPTGPAVVRHRWQRDWTKEQDLDVQRRNMQHRLKVAAMFALFLGLTLWLAYYLFFGPRKTPFVPIAVTKYDFPIPPNAFAREDVKQFQQLQESLALVDGTENEEKDLNQSWDNVPDGVARLSKLLDEAAGKASSKEVLVIYLSMHGVVDVDAQGQPHAYLLPPSGGGTKEWLPVSLVFEELKQPGLAERKKLLVLDAQRLDSNWQLGQLYNGFGAALKDDFVAAKVPNLAVLTAAAPGQVAWSWPEARHSSFGRFFGDALGGAADGFSTDKSADNKISLAELEDYVRTQCDKWASENRADRQTPYLLSTTDNARKWVVAAAPTRGCLKWLEDWLSGKAPDVPAEETAQQEEGTRPELANLWQDRDVLKDEGAIRRDPLAWAQFEHRLLWGEQLADAGQDYVNLSQDNLSELARLKKQLSLPAADNPASTIPLAEQMGGNPDGLAAAQKTWQGFQSGIQLDEVNKELKRLGLDAPGASNFSEIQFLQLLSNHLPPNDWKVSDRIQKALQLRNEGERVAAPDDIRVTSWLAPGVTAADDLRRVAEDKLFIGGKGQDRLPDDERLRAEELYAKIRKLREVLAGAYALRDTVAAEAPYLAAWLSRRLPATLEAGTRATNATPEGEGTTQLADEAQRRKEEQEQFDILLKDELPKLLAAYRAFSLNSLNPPDAENLADAATIETQTRTIETRVGELRELYGKLQRAFDAELENLKRLAGNTGKNDTPKLRRIAAVLSVPLIDSNDRQNLQADYELISGTRSNDWQPKLEPTPPLTSEREDEHLTRLKRWDATHPALALFSAALPNEAAKDVSWKNWGQAPNERLAALALQGDRLRERLTLGTQGIDSLARVELEIGVEQFGKRSDLASSVSARASLSQADHLLRTMAPFGPSINAEEKDAIAKLQAFDRGYLFRWQARRAMDDFYGSPAPTNSGDFFDWAANRYLDAAAKSLKEFYNSDVAIRSDSAELERRRRAADQIADIQEPEPLDLREGDIEHKLIVSPNAALPRGEMAIYLVPRGQKSTRLHLVRPNVPGLDANDYRPSVPTGLKADNAANSASNAYSLDYSIRPEKNELRGAKIDAVAYLRGHTSEARLLSDPMLVEFRPPDYVPPTVLVTRPALKTGELMFIFDCSGSMAEPTPTGTRFAIARNVLFGIDDKGGVLDRLAGTGLYRVGLRIYGHRVGWNPTAPAQARRNPAILKLFPAQVNADRYKQELEGIRPGNDVDRLLPIGNFTQVELREIKNLFFNPAFQPWGITPLYYSIDLALKHDFVPGGNALERRIVVLTDGNDQQNQDRDLPEADRVDATLLRANFKKYQQTHPGQEVKLDIVGFQVGEAPVLREIARENGGQYYSAGNPKQLLNSLEESLGLSNYVVLPPDGKEIGPGDFGKPLQIIPPPRKRTPYKIRVSKGTSETDVELEGGEAIELELNHAGDLVHKRFGAEPADELRESAEKLFNPAANVGPREVFLGSHQPPAQRGDERRFLISVQNQDEKKFSPRPAEVWAEITPLVPHANEPQPTYTFFDAYYEPHRPVPVLGFEVPHWPAEAEEAEVKFWCKYLPTEPEDTVNVAELADRPQVEHPIKNLTGARFTIKVAAVGDPAEEVSEVTVTVAQSGTGREPIKVEMFPAPAAVEHRYFGSNQTVRHRFRYEGVTDKQLRDKFDNRGYVVRFTSAQKLKAGAITQEKNPFRVVIPH